MASLRLFNSLTRRREEFHPLNPPRVGLYTCGPTVYSSPHVGNFRAYLFSDTLKRVLRANGYQVTQVLNITDVGHLTSDADEGEDKLEQGARSEGLTVWQVAEKYSREFLDGLAQLNILPPEILAKATDHVPAMIALIERLVAKGVTYETDQAIYFDVTKFPTYTALSGQPLEAKKTAARAAVFSDPAKRHPADFALWFRRRGKFQNHAMHWPSPWGEGFPGWHIECSAMSRQYLGDQFDIHTGGREHIPVHHTNEIAQSEAATGRSPFVRYWLHHEFLVMPEGKMAKSKGNIARLAELVDRGIDPLAFRYFCHQAHYRSPLTFSWEAMEAAAKGLRNLQLRIGLLKGESKIGCAEFEQQFLAAVNDDLNTPQALAILHALLRSDYPDEAKRQTLIRFESVLGLKLNEIPALAVPSELLAKIKPILEQREGCRRKKDFARADELRNDINARLATAGFHVEDSEDGPVIAPRR